MRYGTCLMSAKSAVCCICQSREGANPAGAGDQPDLWKTDHKIILLLNMPSLEQGGKMCQ